MKRKALLIFMLFALLSGTAWAQTPYTSYTYDDGTSHYASSQSPSKLVDNIKTADSKWCVTQFTDHSPIYVEFHSAEPIVPVGYVMTTGGDNSQYTGRNPRSWVIKAKRNSSDNWSTIETQSGNTTLQDVNLTDYTFNINNNTEYQYFRFEVSAIANTGSGYNVFQLTELQFLVNSSGSGSTLTVANQTGTNSEIPVYGTWVDAYQHTQTIYPSSMLTDMQGGQITKLTYYLQSSASASWGNARFKVTLGTTTTSEFPSGTGNYLTLSNSVEVYTNGALDATGSTMVINFTTPYNYTSGNLVVDIQETTTGTYKGASFYGESASIRYSMKKYSSSSVPTQGDATTFMPKTTFTYIPVPTCEDFDSTSGTGSYSTGGVLPSGWNRIYNGTVYGNTETAPAYMPHVTTNSNGTPGAPNSSNYICFYSSGSTSEYSYAIMPALASSDKAVTHLSFNYKLESSGYGTLTYGTIDGTDANTYNVLGSYNAASGSVDVDLNINQTAGKRIAFRWYKTSTWYTCGIDDVCYTTTTIPYPTIINNISDWNSFCSAVNGGFSYNGMTVTLNADISVTTMCGSYTSDTDYKAFSGTFDGGGHTLTINVSNQKRFAAPFKCVNGATIQNLKTAGTISGESGSGNDGKLLAGVVGVSFGNTIVQGCSSSATITADHGSDAAFGGIVAAYKTGTLTIEGCAFEGTMGGGTSNTRCGGIVSYRYGGSCVVRNSIFAPASINVSTSDDGDTYTIARQSNNANVTIENCYYTTVLGAIQGKQIYTITGVSPVTVAMSGTETNYGASGIKAYKNGSTQLPGLLHDGNIIAGSGDNVGLTLGGASGYSADYGTLSGSGSSYTLAMTANNTLISPLYAINASANPNAGGSVIGAGNYIQGSSCTLTASANNGYCFDNWTENGSVVSTSPSYLFNVTGSRTLVANFVSLDANNITVTGTTTISCGNTTTLTASGLTDVTYNWYSDAACTQLVQANSASLTTGVLYDNATYYVKAVKSNTIEQEATFSYTGSAQTCSIPVGFTSAQLEVWGAQGGNNSSQGGKGGYSIGMLNNLTNISSLYVYVGQQSISTSGGWNGGGGMTNYGRGGGGGTDIRLNGNTYYDRIIVAGGGGGAGFSSCYGGYGGGETGGAGATGSYAGGGGGTQTSGGSCYNSSYAGVFGSASTNSGHNGGGGGGGWYGGGAGIDGGSDSGAGGGSGYVWTSSTASYAPSGYNVSSSYYLEDAYTTPGNESFPAPGGGTETGHEGNGYARITFYAVEECESDAKAVTITVNQPAAPTNVTATADLTTATVSWTGNGASSWEYSIDGGTNWTPTSNTSVNLTGLTIGTSYTFEVKAVSGTCESAVATVEFTTTAEVAITKQILGYNEDDNPNKPNGRWYLIASPLNTSIAPTLVTNMVTNPAVNYDLFSFKQDPTVDPNTGIGLEWINYKESSANGGGFDLEPTKGYLYANANTVTLTFTGVPYQDNGAGQVIVSLTHTTGYNWSDWNLVGNPYNGNAYLDGPFYKMNPAGTDVVAVENSNNQSIIEPMEGVFVKYDEDEDYVAAAFSRASRAQVANLALNVTKDRGLVDRAFVSFGGKRSLPKFQLNESHTKVYIPKDDKDYAVVIAESEMGELPVNFKAEHNGSYTIGFTAQEVRFAYLHLIDNKTGADVDLLETPSYTFDATTTDYASRFKLVFATGDGDGDSFAFYSNGSWVVANEGEAVLQVVDVTGRILRSENINGSTTLNFNAAAGVYMLRLLNGEDVKVQKVVVR